MRLLAALVALLATAAPAQAAWFGGEPLDTGVSALGGVDLHRDGTGAVAYVKGGQVLIARKAGGAWQLPETVAAGSDPAVAAGKGHRLVAAFASGGGVFGAVAPAGPAPQPLGAPVRLGDGNGPVSVDMGANGHAYVAWSAGGDVRAARLDEHTGWAGVPVALDIDPAADAGSGSDRPRVAAGADGHAIVTWGENGRVWERRLLGTRLSAHPQDAGPGTAPQIDVEDDSSFASVVLSGPGGTLWRRLKGSAFEAPVGVGGPSQAADVAVDGRGMGYAVAAAPSGEITGLAFDDDVAAALVAVGSGSDPVTAVGELGEVAVAWRTASDVRARIADQPEPLQPEAVLSRAELPPPGPPAIASDLRGDVAVAMLQGDQLVIAEHDQPPGKPAGGTTEHWRARARPELRWRAGSEQWGPVSFSILLDGTPIATTAATTIRVPARIPDGSHSWIVRAVDRRGQVVDSDARRLRVDVTAPVPKLKIRRSGSLARITVIATDAASGIKRTKLTFPDGSSTGARSLQRRFGSGTHSLKLGVVDRAGNVARKIFRLRVP